MSNSCGKFLKELRTRKGLTLVQLSELSGVSNPYLSQIENNKFTPSPDVLRKLYKHLGVEYTRLLSEFGYVEDGEYMDLIKQEQDDRVFTLKGTGQSYVVDLSKFGEESPDLKMFLEYSLEPPFYGDIQLTEEELSFIIDFLELLMNHRKGDND